MGTSRGISTPSGGGWGSAKREITAHIADPETVSPARVVSRVVSAMGGLGLGIIQSGRAAQQPNASRAGGGGRSGGRTPAAHAKQVGRAIAGLGGFASTVQQRGLTDALQSLDLGNLEGRPAVEVIARVAERLADGLDGLDGEILRTALNETILEAAQLEEELGFMDLEAALQTFLNEQGLSGLIELFLARFVSNLVTGAILDHIDQKTGSEAQAEALLSGIEIVCRDKARDMIERAQTAGRFNRMDWFGAAGTLLGRELADSIVAELQAI
jgi:hypothetical protein